MIKIRVGKNVRDRADWDESLARVNTMHCNMLHTSHQRFIHTCTHTPWMSTCHTSVSSPVALQLQLLRRGRQTRMCTARCKWHRMAPSRSTQETRPPSSFLLLLLARRDHPRSKSCSKSRSASHGSFSQSLHGWHLLRSNSERQMRGQRAREHLPTAPTKDLLT
jgi:hypothetical protein